MGKNKDEPKELSELNEVQNKVLDGILALYTEAQKLPLEETRELALAVGTHGSDGDQGVWVDNFADHVLEKLLDDAMEKDLTNAPAKEAKEKAADDPK